MAAGAANLEAAVLKTEGSRAATGRENGTVSKLLLSMAREGNARKTRKTYAAAGTAELLSAQT
jgi:hypothetical protein